MAPWIALLVAFSPILVNLVRNASAHPDDRLTLMAPLLLLLAAWQRPVEHAVGRADGLIAIGIGAAMQLFGLLGGSWSLARLGLPVAALGLARWRGAPSLAVAALLFFAIPLPDTVVRLPSPGLETALARSAGFLLSSLGAPIEVGGATLSAAAGRLNLYAPQGGASLAFAFASFGWYAAVSRGAGIASASFRAALASVAAIPAQWMVVLVTAALLAAGDREAAKLWLREAGWIVLAVLALAVLHHREIMGLVRGRAVANGR